MGCRHTVMLISSDAIGWEAVRTILAALPDLRVVGDATTLSQAHQLATAYRPDAIITEPSIEGIPILPQLVELRRECCLDSKIIVSKIIVLAAHYEPGQVRVPEESGIAGYLLWSDLSRRVLRHALAAVIAGDLILGSRTVVRALMATRPPQIGRAAPMVILTPRQQAILRGLAQGLTREGIAQMEGLSLRTVKRAITEIQAKVGVTTPFALGVAAVRLGLLP